MLDVATIEQRLRDRAEELARELLPAARRDGHYLKCGSVMGEAGSSLVIHIQGGRQGLWDDYAAAERGDMLDLIAAVMRYSTKKDAVVYAKRFLGIYDDYSPDAPARPSPEELKRRAEEARKRSEERLARAAAEMAAKTRRARGVFLAPSSVVVAGSPAEAYLRGRRLLPDAVGHWPGALKFNPEMWNSDLKSHIPAMLGAIYMANGTQIGVHRTFLSQSADGTWGKIAGFDAKKVLGAMWGGFIPISKGRSGKSMHHIVEGEPVYVTEGIEDAIAVKMKMPDARIICAISLGNMAAITLPVAAKRLVIVADRDDKDSVIALLEKAIAAHQARGLSVELVMPPVPHKDINDWLIAVESTGGAISTKRAATHG